jgi:hypothetical protein
MLEREGFAYHANSTEETRAAVDRENVNHRRNVLVFDRPTAVREAFSFGGQPLKVKKPAFNPGSLVLEPLEKHHQRKGGARPVLTARLKAPSPLAALAVTVGLCWMCVCCWQLHGASCGCSD